MAKQPYEQSKADLALSYIPCILAKLDTDTTEMFTAVLQAMREGGYRDGYNDGIKEGRNEKATNQSANDAGLGLSPRRELRPTN